MQQCVICHARFTWKQVSKSLWLAYKPIACTNCGKLYKVQFLSRILASLLLVGSIFAFNLVSYPTSTQAFILAVLVIIPANILVLPYLMRYRLA
nr:TIGR04104 family putative zinc finger protein [Planococcus antarcticus]